MHQFWIKLDCIGEKFVFWVCNKIWYSLEHTWQPIISILSTPLSLHNNLIKHFKIQNATVKLTTRSLFLCKISSATSWASLRQLCFLWIHFSIYHLFFAFKNIYKEIKTVLLYCQQRRTLTHYFSLSWHNEAVVRYFLANFIFIGMTHPTILEPKLSRKSNQKLWKKVKCVFFIVFNLSASKLLYLHLISNISYPKYCLHKLKKTWLLKFRADLQLAFFREAVI